MQNIVSSMQATSGLTRRAFVAGSAVAAAMLLADAQLQAPVALADDSASYDGVDADDSQAVQGGTLKWFVISPAGIEPFSTSENNGCMVSYALFDTLTAMDGADGKVTPLAAESWDVSDDATTFTFHLRQGATFHNGNPVTSKDFKYAWERICRHDFKPSPSTQGSLLQMVKGAADMLAGNASELGVECPDDYTLVVHLEQPFADFPMVVSHPSTAPVQAGCTDTEEDLQAFRVHTVGNGPFEMDGDWTDGQYINVKRYDGYAGKKPNIDAINFQIFKDEESAWTEFQAGNLDFTLIPNGQFGVATQMYGIAGEDGNLVNPGAQVLSGTETTVYCIICNLEDGVMSNKDLRIALSYAINRSAICSTVLENSRVPASDFLPPTLAGWQENGWDHCPAESDADKASEYFEKAGYPLKDGKRDLTITLSTNSGSGNEDIFTMIQADLAACGVTANIETQEWAAYLDSLTAGSYQVGRMGYTADAPSSYSFMQDAFFKGAGSNYSKYDNPDFEQALNDAAAETDEDKRAEAYRAADKMLAEDFPLIPLCVYGHGYVCSSRVHNLLMNPMGYAHYNRCWLQ